MAALTRPKAIFFDWDGTLVDSFSFLAGAHGYVCRKLGMDDFPSEYFRHYFGKQRDYIYDGIYGEQQSVAREHFERYVHENHTQELNLMDGAADLLASAQHLGIVSGIVSNKKSCFLRREVAHFGWDQYFSSIVGAGDADRDKPFADPLLLALSHAGVTPDKEGVWYVGDTQTDLGCARNAGCAGVFVSPEVETLEKPYPFLIVENCSQLRDLLLQCVEN